MALLPPTVQGPLTPLSSTVVVDKVLPGASVELLVNGTPFGSPATATSNSVAIGLFGNPLPPGGAVTARWSLAGQTSSPSLPEVVVGWPSKTLAAPKFSSPIHSEMDWVAFNGLYPGATVEVTGPSGPIGPPQTAPGGFVHFYLDASVSPGDVLTAVQRVQTAAGTTFSSDKAQSLPAENWYPHEGTPPTPAVVGPITECAGGVHVTGAVPGTMLILRTGGGELEYPAVGASFYANLPGQAHAPETFAARTVFRRVHRQSGFSPAVGIDPAAALSKPRLVISGFACPAQGAVAAVDLTPKCEMTIELHTGGTVTELGRAGTPNEATSTDVPLPDLSGLIAQVPPHSFLILRETQCALMAASDPAYMAPFNTPIMFKPNIDNGPTACSMWMHVNGVYGALVVAHSDDPDWPVLSSPTLLPDSNFDTWLHLNRPLRDGENVWVELLTGCVPANLRQSDPVPVGSLPDLDAIRVQRPNYPLKNARVWVERAISGATVHVYIGDKWRASQEWLWLYSSIPVGELHPEDQIRVRQALCGKIGNLSPPETVALGQLKLRPDPKTLERGKVTQLTIVAHEPLTGIDRGGLPITLNGATVGMTGQPFTINVTSTTPTPLHFEVAREGFQTALLDVPVVAPAPPPPAELTVVLNVTLGLSAQAITKVDWSLLGAGRVLTKSDTPNLATSTVHIPIPAPAPGPDIYNLSGVAVVTYTEPGTGTKITKTVDKFLSINGLIGSIQVEWKGAARTAEINTGVQTNPNTGEPVFYMVLNKLS